MPSYEDEMSGNFPLLHENRRSECTVFSNTLESVQRSKQKFVTFDCLVHRFQGYCEYILARDCTGGLFDIHIENDPLLHSAIRSAVVGGVAVRAEGVGVIKAIFAREKVKVYMNGKRIKWPSTIDTADGSRVLLSTDAVEDRVEIFLAATDVKIVLVGQTKIVVSVPPSFKNKTCGLCGNFNGNPNDDLMMPSRKSLSISSVNDSTSAISISNVHKFGLQWTAVSRERLILLRNDDCRDPTDVSYCELPNQRTNVERFCHVIIDPKGPFAECHPYTAPGLAYRKCVLIGCLHRGNKTKACSTIRSYQIQCQQCNKKFYSAIVPECCKPLVQISFSRKSSRFLLQL